MKAKTASDERRLVSSQKKETKGNGVLGEHGFDVHPKIITGREREWRILCARLVWARKWDT